MLQVRRRGRRGETGKQVGWRFYHGGVHVPVLNPENQICWVGHTSSLLVGCLTLNQAPLELPLRLEGQRN